MSEWTIEIETAPAVTADDEALSTIHDALNNDPIALGAVVSCHVPTETVSALYQVEAETLREAAANGLEAFQRALAAAGIEDPGGRMMVEPFTDEQETTVPFDRKAVLA